MPAALITGGHSGIGYEAARELARSSQFDLILAGRDVARVEAAAGRIRADYGVKVTPLLLDLASLASVREAAARCRTMIDVGDIDTLQAVLCNAGARIESVTYTQDGYEETFATNYLGHFLLIELLIDCVAENGRVVFTSSGTHDPDTMDGKLVGAAVEPNAMALAYVGKEGQRPLSAGRRYATSKLCNILHAYELDRRLRRSHSRIASIAFDPGAVTGTGFLRNMPGPVQWLATTSCFHWLQRRLGVTIGDLHFSGCAVGRLAGDPEFSHSSGKYFQSSDRHLNERRSSKTSYDPQLAMRLWEDSKRLVHLTPHEESKLLR